jgi:hypothetical protein
VHHHHQQQLQPSARMLAAPARRQRQAVASAQQQQAQQEPAEQPQAQLQLSKQQELQQPKQQQQEQQQQQPDPQQRGPLRWLRRNVSRTLSQWRLLQPQQVLQSLRVILSGVGLGLLMLALRYSFLQQARAAPREVLYSGVCVVGVA